MAIDTPPSRRHLERPSGSEVVVNAVPGVPRRLLIEVGSMLRLFGDVVRSVAKDPKGFWSDTRDEAYDLVRYGLVASVLTVLLFTFVVTSVGYALLGVLGSPERMAQFTLTIGVRETSAFITAMVVSGVMGTAVTADLGARKIREEIDAMRVLGLDPLRLLVIPRVICLSVMTVLFAMLSNIASILCGILVGVVIGDVNFHVYMANLLRNMTAVELWGLVIKTLLIGILVGVVHCFKGLNVGGGPQDVGKAVNQSVVITFVGMFLINLLFNATIQGLYPQLQTVR